MTYREGIVAAARRAGRAALDSIFAVLFGVEGETALPTEARWSRNNRGPIDRGGDQLGETKVCCFGARFNR